MASLFILPLLTAASLLAQDTTATTTSSFSQTVHTTPIDRRLDTFVTRIVGKVAPSTIVYDQSFNLPLEAPEVQDAIRKAIAGMQAASAVAIQAPARTGHESSTETRVETARTKVTKTIGVTRRETPGPASIVIGTLATEAEPCAGYTGGTPLGLDGLSAEDGFQFHFTTPVTPVRCPLPGTRFTVPDATKNTDTLTHIHTDIYQTVTTIRTVQDSNTYTLIGNLGSSTGGPPLEGPGPTEDAGMLIRYALNLDKGDALLNVTNSGARGAALAAGTSASTTGAICLNVYAFSPDDQLVTCCSCPVTPNGLISLSARNDLLGPTTRSPVPTSLLIKLNPSVPVGGSCSGSAAKPGSLAPGLHAWGTTIQVASPSTTDVTETPFLHTSSSVGEREELAARCSMFLANGSGFGICRSCRLGGFSAGRIDAAR